MAFKYTSLDNLPKIEVPYEQIGTLVQDWQQKKDITELKLEENINFAEDFEADKELANEIVGYKNQLANELAQVAQTGDASAYMRNLGSTAKNLALLESEHGVISKLDLRDKQWSAIKTTMKDIYSDDPVKEAMYEERVKKQINEAGPIYDVETGQVADIDFNTENLPKHYSDKEIQEALLAPMKVKALEILEEEGVDDAIIKRLNGSQNLVQLNRIVEGKRFEKIFNAIKDTVDPSIIRSLEDSGRAGLTMGDDVMKQSAAEYYKDSYTLNENGDIVFDINSPNHPLNKKVRGLAKLAEEEKLRLNNTVTSEPKGSTTNVTVNNSAPNEETVIRQHYKKTGYFHVNSVEENRILSEVAAAGKPLTKDNIEDLPSINTRDLNFASEEATNVFDKVISAPTVGEVVPGVNLLQGDEVKEEQVEEYVNKSLGYLPEGLRKETIEGLTNFYKDMRDHILLQQSTENKLVTDLDPGPNINDYITNSGVRTMLKQGKVGGVINFEELAKIEAGANENTIMVDGEEVSVLSDQNFRGGYEHLLSDRSFRGVMVDRYNSVLEGVTDKQLSSMFDFTEKELKNNTELRSRLAKTYANSQVTGEFMAAKHHFNKQSDNLDLAFVTNVVAEEDINGRKVSNASVSDMRERFGINSRNIAVKENKDDGTYSVTKFDLEEGQQMIMIPKKNENLGLEAGYYTVTEFYDALRRSNLFDASTGKDSGGGTLEGTKEGDGNQNLLNALSWNGIVSSEALMNSGDYNSLAYSLRDKLASGESQAEGFSISVNRSFKGDKRKASDHSRIEFVVVGGDVTNLGSPENSVTTQLSSNSVNNKVSVSQGSNEYKMFEESFTKRINGFQAQYKILEAQGKTKEAEVVKQKIQESTAALNSLQKGTVKIKKRTDIRTSHELVGEQYSNAQVEANDLETLYKWAKANPNDPMLVNANIDILALEQQKNEAVRRRKELSEQYNNLIGSKSPLMFDDDLQKSFLSRYSIQYGDGTAWFDLSDNEYRSIVEKSAAKSDADKMVNLLSKYSYRKNAVPTKYGK